VPSSVQRGNGDSCCASTGSFNSRRADLNESRWFAQRHAEAQGGPSASSAGTSL